MYKIRLAPIKSAGSGFGQPLAAQRQPTRDGWHQMIKKKNSKWLPLAAASILGQASRSLFENREPTAEKPFLPIFSIIFVK